MAIIPGTPIVTLPVSTVALEDNKDEIRSLMGAASDAEVMKLAGTQTVTGDKTFSGLVNMSNTGSPSPTSGMTRDLVAAAFAMSPRVHQMIPYTTGSATGLQTAVSAGDHTGVTQLVISSVANAAARVRLCDDFGFSDVQTPQSFGFATPFALRVPIALTALDGAQRVYVLRIYACTNGTMAAQISGNHPYPANTRGICAEIRHTEDGLGFEARLCARDGTAVAAGTAIASHAWDVPWARISSDNTTKHYDFTIKSDGLGNAELFASVFSMVTGQSPASWHPDPVVSLSGAGVPFTNEFVANYWTRPEVQVIGNNLVAMGTNQFVRIFQCTAVYGG
jgi:hypothetical protein